MAGIPKGPKTLPTDMLGANSIIPIPPALRDSSISDLANAVGSLTVRDYTLVNFVFLTSSQSCDLSSMRSF